MILANIDCRIRHVPLETAAARLDIDSSSHLKLSITEAG
jgi:hypothetical protein